MIELTNNTQLFNALRLEYLLANLLPAELFAKSKQICGNLKEGATTAPICFKYRGQTAVLEVTKHQWPLKEQKCPLEEVHVFQINLKFEGDKQKHRAAYYAALLWTLLQDPHFPLSVNGEPCQEAYKVTYRLQMEADAADLLAD